MANVFMVALSLVVILSSGGILVWFFRRLRRIEDELLGSQRREALQTATEAAALAADSETESGDDTTER
jgi:hypothetical protein